LLFCPGVFSGWRDQKPNRHAGIRFQCLNRNMRRCSEEERDGRRKNYRRQRSTKLEAFPRLPSEPIIVPRSRSTAAASSLAGSLQDSMPGPSLRRHSGARARLRVSEWQNCGELRRDFGVAEPRVRPQCSASRPVRKSGSRDAYEVQSDASKREAESNYAPLSKMSRAWLARLVWVLRRPIDVAIQGRESRLEIRVA